MHLYFFGSGANAPAVIRDIIENELMEEYHWLPQEIAKIPYKKLQKLFLIKKQKSAETQAKANINKFKQSRQSAGSGGSRSFVREI